jgi:flagellar hook-associated protein 2
MSFVFTGSPAALRLATAEGAEASGAFQINGVTISYNKYYDSLNAVISRINSSSAGVLAQYDAASDKLVLTSKITGGSTILAEDIGGNFLEAFSIDEESTQTLGSNARYSIDTVAGGEIFTSSTNTITMIPGVTMSLKAVSPVDSYGEYAATTVAVSVNTAGAVSAVSGFVTSYNEVLQSLAASTAYNTDTGEAGTLNGNAQVRDILRNLQSLVSGMAEGLTDAPRTLLDLGISIGSGGALTVDESVLSDAVAANPERVAQVLTGYAGSASLVSGGTGCISSVSGRPTESSQAVAGTYRIVSDVEGNLTAFFTPSGGVEALLGTGTITAGGTNTTLIAGLTLRAGSELIAGTNTVTKPASQTGLFKNLELYLERSTSTTGVLSVEEESIQERIESLQSQMERMDVRLALRQTTLERQFATMETILSRMQTQSTWLTTQIQSLNNNWMRGT